MSGPQNTNEVAMHLASLGRELAATVAAMDRAEVEAVNRREDYTQANSRAFIKAEGAMDIRKHTAILETHEERIAAELAEVVVRGTRRSIDSIKVRIDIGRSVGAALRTEINLAGHQGES